MNIDFSEKRWKTIKQNYSRWWAGDLKRPLISVSLSGRTPTRSKPAEPYHHFNSYYGADFTVAHIVDWYEYQLEGTYFLGDGFPNVWPNYGPGVCAAYLGAQVESGSMEAPTTWFHPREIKEAKDLHLKVIPDNPWYLIMQNLYREMQARFGGMVQLSMTDLGGAMDIVSTFRPSERLVFDLYDCPEEVDRLSWEAHDAWWEVFHTFGKILDKNPGYTAWTPIFSEQPYYMLQCDFAYMIGPEMFEQFILPEITAMCKKIPNTFYHLDGAGQLPHLDMLLAIPELKGIQWVPGDGAPDITQWPEVHRKIRKAGKLVQIWAGGHSRYGWETLDVIADQLGSAEGLIMIGFGSIEKDEKTVLKLLDKYGC